MENYTNIFKKKTIFISEVSPSSLAGADALSKAKDVLRKLKLIIFIEIKESELNQYL